MIISKQLVFGISREWLAKIPKSRFLSMRHTQQVPYQATTRHSSLFDILSKQSMATKMCQGQIHGIIICNSIIAVEITFTRTDDRPITPQHLRPHPTSSYYLTTITLPVPHSQDSHQRMCIKMPECDIFWATLLIGCYDYRTHSPSIGSFGDRCLERPGYHSR